MNGQARLTGVPETMLLTLYHRALETHRLDCLFRDDFAVSFVEQIDHDFSKFDDWRMEWVVPVRTWLIDAAVRSFLERSPDGSVITLGAGLCTRALRLDNGQARWVSVDLDVIQPFWQSLIGNSARNRFVVGSVTDFSWIRRILRDTWGGALLVVAEGVFQYLPGARVRDVVVTIRHRLPGAELILDLLGEVTVKFARLNPALAATDSAFQWGLNDGAEMAAWAPDIELLAQWYMMDYCPERQGHLAMLPRMYGGKGRFEKVARLRLGRPACQA